MTTLREAAQQALEAFRMCVPMDGKHAEADAAFRNLRAALAQQDEPAQKPFGYLWPTCRHPEFRFTQQKRDGVDGMPLYTAPPQRKPLVDPAEYDDAGAAERYNRGLK